MKTATAQVSVKLKKGTKEQLMEDAFAYRVPMEVTRILKLSNGDRYPVCPRCQITVEREYMRFCNRCGQKLGWSKLKNAITVYPGFDSVAKKGKKRHLSLF